MLKAFAAADADIRLVLITSLLSNAGIFMVIPFLAVYLSGEANISDFQIGLIIGAAFWFQRAGAFFGGLLADCCGIKKTMFLGLAARIPGYVSVALTTDFYLLMLSCILIGLGSSIYLPAAKSFLAQSADEAQRLSILSLRIVFSNIGVALGPLLGALIFKIEPVIMFFAAALVFVFLLFGNGRLRAERSFRLSAPKPKPADICRLLANKTMLAAGFFMFVFSALYMQLESAMPLYVNALFGRAALSAVFVCNALIIIFLQMPVGAYFCGSKPRAPVLCGFLLFAAAFLLFPRAGGLSAGGALFAGIILFSLAEIILQIHLDYKIAAVSAAAPATAFGALSLAGAFGGLFGSAAGTYLYARPAGGLTLWQWAALAALLTAIAAAAPLAAAMRRLRR